MSHPLGPFHEGSVRAGDDSPQERIAAKILREEILRRCPSFTFRENSRGGKSVDFKFSHAQGDSDSYGIRVRGSTGSATVDISGIGNTSLLHAVGKLLRHINFDDGISISRLNIKLEATHPHRGQELSIYRYIDSWGYEDWERYTRELVLWGANWIWSTTSCNAPLTGCSEDTAASWEKHCATQNAQAEIASTYDMKFGVHSFPNNISPDLVTPGISWKGSYVCPSNSEARGLILESRRMLFRRLRKIDAVFTSSHDPGGCPCERCTPWVKTFMPLMQEEASVLREDHPETEFYISNQGLSRDENLWLFEHLKKERPDWLDGLVWGPQSRPLSELRSGLPDKYKILAFPDITHLILCQYPVVGFDHANALIHHRESPTYRPRAMDRIYSEIRDLSSGSFPYSEGLHDDLNKAVWSGLYWGVKPAESVAEYARWYFGSGAQNEVQKIIFDLESSWKRPVIDNPAISRILRNAEEVGTKIEKGEGNWRYQMLLLRCLVDLYVQLKLQGEREIERRTLEVLGNGDLGMDERINLALELIGSAEDAEITNLARRISFIGQRLEDSLGLIFHPLDRLKVPISNLPWIEKHLKVALSSMEIEKDRIISKITKYEETGPGECFEDCGNVERESHRVTGEDYFLEDIDPSVRLSKRRMSYGRSEWDSDVVYRFDDLNQGRPYRLYLTYLTNRRMRGSQLLVANGTTIHDDTQLPENNSITYEYDIPGELTRKGKLELRFIRGSSGRGPLVSEIWLSPLE